MLEHIGRRSGRRRFVVLEVVDAQPPRRYVVVSGFGERAQWLRNVEVHPNVRLYAKSHAPVEAVAAILTPPQAVAALRSYKAAHPRAWTRLRPVLERTLGVPINEDRPQLPVMELATSRGG